MENNEDKQTQDTRYNLDGATFQLLGELQRSAVSFTLKRSFDEAFNRWVSIRTLIEPCIEDDESKDLDILENQYHRLIYFKIPEGLDDVKPFLGLSKKELFKENKINQFKSIKLKRYSKQILRFMKKYSLTLTGKEMKTELN